MGWYEQAIRRYEHHRWTVDGNRRVFPFAWGLEHIGGTAEARAGRGDGAGAREYLEKWSRETVARSDEWYGISRTRHAVGARLPRYRSSWSDYRP